MLRSLSSRLLLAFAFVIVLSLALSAVGTLFLLRDQQRDAAEERVGRLAEPITLAVALLEQADVDPGEIKAVVHDYAKSFDVRVLLVDREGLVVSDTDARLMGSIVDVFLQPGARITERGGARFRIASFSADGEELLLFAPEQDTLQLDANSLVELQTFAFASLGRPEVFAEPLADLLETPDVVKILAPSSVRPLIAVTEAEITSAWQEIIPQLAIAGGIALLASAVVAVVIARSISRPLARVTKAAQEMALGRYDQELDLQGEDEVGRLGQAFNAMARQVSRSHQTMRDLLANVSHELKTPLTSIQGFSQAMEEGTISTPEEYREAGRIINEETQRMRRLVEDLIELSQLESGQVAIQQEPVDLAALLRVCAGRFERRLRETGATLQLDLTPLPSLEGDERRLEQAFANLIDNAVRHTSKDGAITVRATTRDGRIIVAIHNTGSYIPSEDLPRVFERFFQLDRNRSSGVGGVGLGLAIASEVVQAHQGEISATSDSEQGTEFTVTLPLGSRGRSGGGVEADA